jgi:hypothetical protein
LRLTAFKRHRDGRLPMKHLSDFKPLKKLSLPGIGDLHVSGLTLIVGPNSSGKSQLLQDLFQRISGEPRTLVVASDIEIDKPSKWSDFLETLESDGYLETFEDDSGNKQLRARTLYVGSGQPISQIQHSQGQSWHEAYIPTTGASTKRRSEFLNHFGRLLVAGLFLDRRLTSLSQVGPIDFQTQSPQHDLHALYANDSAKAELLKELVSSFGKSVWPDMSRGNGLCLRVSDEGILPSAEDRHSYKKMSEYRTIETEGDGLKSYVATCVSLLLGLRPVVLIDEPEMCLHPPQAYNLGRFIGKYGASADTATFVSTHSSHILRGVIQTAPGVRIVRLTRRGREFNAHYVPAETLTEALARPTLRAESVLDGIFAQAVVVLEADGDRLVYQSAWETLANEIRLDIHFAAVGGTGGIADTCRLYKTLRIPVAVIADLDLIANRDRLNRVLTVMADPTTATTIITAADVVMNEIAKLPPTVTPNDVRAALNAVLAGSMDWDKQDDAVVRKELKRVANELDRMRTLKQGGVNAFSDPITAQLIALVESLKGVGVFVVPVGELEEWLSGRGVAESKSNKWAWASAAAQCIQKAGSQTDDIWSFMRTIGAHLAKNPPSI